MKKVLFLICFMLALTSCDKGELVKGQFIYYDGAAVLQTDSIVYGVIINDKALELDKLSKQFKKEDTDMVSVELRGKLIPRPENEEGWDYSIDIKEIVNVSESEEDNDIIKFGDE